MPHDKGIKLKSINYKHFKNYGCLQGIQLIFTNDVKTPWFETREAKSNEELEVQSIEIDTAQTIRYISLNVYRKMSLRGIRLIDADG